MARNELVSFSKIYQLPVLFRSKNRLAKRLSNHFEYLIRDDQFIAGKIEEFTHDHVIECLDERGIPSDGLDFETAKRHLHEWIKLSLLKEPTIPPALLILSALIRRTSVNAV